MNKNDIETTHFPYRLETYVHSDKIRANKAAAIVKITTETDFALKSESFITLCKKMAKLACGFQTDSLEVLFKETDLQKDIEAVSKELKENIEVSYIQFFK